MYLLRAREPVQLVIGIFGCLVVDAPLFHLKNRAVPSRTRALAKLIIGLSLFPVRFLHFLLYLSAYIFENVTRYNEKCKKNINKTHTLTEINHPKKSEKTPEFCTICIMTKTMHRRYDATDRTTTFDHTQPLDYQHSCFVDVSLF